MEYRTANMPGEFEDVEITCPKCDSTQVLVVTSEEGYFKVLQCFKCGFRNATAS